MSGYYLRVEGVNLSNFVYDTKDLSCIRGGGLLLLDAIDRVQKQLESIVGKDNVTPVSTGASSGLFAIQTTNGEEIRDQIEKFLNEDKQLKHATFVVDVIEAGEEKDFAEKKETLLAMNRWRQMRSPTLAIPKNWGNSADACETDLVRPAFPQRETSTSVWKRTEYGRTEKRGKLYTRLTGLPEENAKFTNDLNELSEDESQGNLNHKIAVIYADGNSFGKLQSGFDLQTLQRFDTEIKEKRRSFLTKLLNKMSNDPVGWKNRDRYRIETLLWGGDEFMLVVPAWKGWETLQLFYTISATWDFTYRDNDNKDVSLKLTHSAGLVFCHHKAPIHRIKALAHDLAEVCKNKRVVDEKDNYFSYQALESFDHIGGDVETYLKKVSIGDLARPMILSGSNMTDIRQNIEELKGDSEFARGRLHGIVKKLRGNDIDGAEDEIKRIKNASGEGSGPIFENLDKLMHGQNSWLHLADLYDYIAAKGE